MGRFFTGPWVSVSHLALLLARECLYHTLHSYWPVSVCITPCTLAGLWVSVSHLALLLARECLYHTLHSYWPVSVCITPCTLAGLWVSVSHLALLQASDIVLMSGKICVWQELKVGIMRTNWKWELWWQIESGNYKDKLKVGTMMTNWKWELWGQIESGNYDDKLKVGIMRTNWKWKLWGQIESGNCEDKFLLLFSATFTFMCYVKKRGGMWWFLKADNSDDMSFELFWWFWYSGIIWRYWVHLTESHNVRTLYDHSCLFTSAATLLHMWQVS